MDTRFHNRAKRFLAVGLLSGSLLTPAIASAQTLPAGTPPAESTGTITGIVTCGTAGQSADVAPESAEVLLQGSNLTTLTTEGGRFILTNVPTTGVFTLDVVASNDSFQTSTVPGVSVGANQTLDVGSIDLSVCPAPSLAQMTQPDDQDQPNQSDQGSN